MLNLLLALPAKVCMMILYVYVDLCRLCNFLQMHVLSDAPSDESNYAYITMPAVSLSWIIGNAHIIVGYLFSNAFNILTFGQ